PAPSSELVIFFGSSSLHVGTLLLYGHAEKIQVKQMALPLTGHIPMEMDLLKRKIHGMPSGHINSQIPFYYTDFYTKEQFFLHLAMSGSILK
ncbi:MAG: hypothetical protein V1862_11345, partial [Methanobacteriota archaeon]